MTAPLDDILAWLRARCPDTPRHRLRAGDVRYCRSADGLDTMMLRVAEGGWVLVTGRCVVHSDGSHRPAGAACFNLAASAVDALANYYTDEELRGIDGHS
jgi:hypothetical protein